MKAMSRCRRPLFVLAFLPFVALLADPSRAAGQLQTMSVTKIADGVYGAIYSEMKQDPVQSNSLIIIGDSGVCVVDAHYTPSAARATIAEIRKLTRLPVRYVITTHWHDDHVFGNQEYRAAWPGVSFVAQDHARESMVKELAEHRAQLIKSYGGAVPRIQQRLKDGVDKDGKPLTAERRAFLVEMLPIYRAYAADFEAVRITLPDVTFDKELTLHLGNREIKVLSFGPGNTKGDAVIWLPKEKIAEVGDLVVYPVPFIYGGYPSSWVSVLEAVKALGPEIIVPGHGPVMRDFKYVDQVSGLLQSMATQARDAATKGLTLDQTRAAFDLKQYHDTFVGGLEDREGTFQASILQSGIEAAYEEAKGIKNEG
jgi:glyoxylase-like metal-dependent hydrolase (beta-lactamase superfamily II)